MSWMSMSRESGQSLADLLAADRPSVGVRVEVVDGRKHKGKAGKVFWHGRDGYSGAWRYGSDFEKSCRDIRGTYGFRVGVETDAGEKFFVPATHIKLLKGA